MDNLFWFIALLASLLVNAFQLKMHYKEKKDLFAKFMAKTLGEAEFFEKAYPTQVKEELKRMEDQRKKEENLTPEQIKTKEIAARF